MKSMHLRFSDLTRSFIFASLIAVVFAIPVSASSTVSGFVYDQNRNPLASVDIELLNENYVLRERTRTNGVGRYQFTNVADGRYYVRALPFRFNLEDDTQEIIVENYSIRGEGVSFMEKDFYLKAKEGGLGDTTTGVIFAESVPKDAEEMLKAALGVLEKDKQKGLVELYNVIRKYPRYYAATQFLGKELIKKEQYLEAARMFMNAAEINPRSSAAFYYMAFSLSSLGKDYMQASLIALEKARGLAPNAYQVPLLTGKLLRKQGDLAGAEKNLLAAKKLAHERIPEIHMELSQLYGNDLKQFGKAADELELYLKASDEDDPKVKKVISDLRAKAKGSS